MWPVALLLRIWWRTVRIEASPEALAIVTDQSQTTVFIMWHNRLLMMPELVRRYRAGHPISGLISASRDGAWLAALFSAVGVGVVRGSSSRLGREAVGALVETLQSGCDIGITPDGPRGPVYVMKPGALVVGKRARARVVLAGVDFESSWRVASWDGFHLPRPFSRMHLRFEVVDAQTLEDSEESARDLGRRLVALNPDRIPAPPRRKG